MQKVDKHINDLLYNHDCVIVPDFGGFVANYASAKIHPVQHTFIPPSKNIVFNKNLKTNDGLLANHIVIAENTNYPEAIKYISNFVEYTNEQLKKGAKVKIDEVGTLFLDVERNINFQPSATNYLLQSFGLPEFQSPAIKRDNISKRIEKEFKDRVAVAPAKKKVNGKRIITLAIAAPLVFALLWIPLKTDLLKNINYANLNPFAAKEIKNEPTKVKPKQIVVLPIVKKDTAVTIANVDSTAISEQPTVKPVKADSTAVTKTTAVNLDFKFHIVAGCFAIEKNAIKFVASLQQQNIDAAIIGKNDKQLFVVSVGNYATYKETNKEMANIRKQLPNVWLYKN
jgi:cell division septation protein DedD